MLSQWIPSEERSKAGSFVYVGAPLGTVFATAISGVILKNTSWPWVFYFFGFTGILWYLAWIVLCYNNPKEHPFISSAEAQYLEERMNKHVLDNPPPVPWRHVFKSKPMWALVAVHVAHDFGFYTFATDLPKYMSRSINNYIHTGFK